MADDYTWTDKKEQDLFADSTVFGNPTRESEVKERIRKLVEFKAWLRSTVISDSFTTSDELGRKIAIALQQYIPKLQAEPIRQDRISIARLPITSSNLFGRETELEILDDALNEFQHKHRQLRCVGWRRQDSTCKSLDQATNGTR